MSNPGPNTQSTQNLVPALLISSSGSTSLKGLGGNNFYGCCTLVQQTGTQTTIATATSTSLTMYQKIALDTALVDTHGAADLVNSQIVVPSWAKFVRVSGHISFPDQNVGSGHASVHLWRNVNGGVGLTTTGITYYPLPLNADRPTPEAHYHNRVYYPQFNPVGQPAGASYVSVLAATGWIPVMAAGEIWTLYGWQDSGGSITTPVGVENWLTVDFAQGI